MRILVNATTLKEGGAIQKAVELMTLVHDFGAQDDWLFLVSPEVHDNWLYPQATDHYQTSIIPVSPARLLQGHNSRRMMTQAEKAFQPDVAFTVFGPAYYIFSCPHLLGFAVGWVTHPTALAWAALPFLKRLRLKLWCIYVAHWCRFANLWVTETDVSGVGFAKQLGVDKHRIKTVPNCCSASYFKATKNSVVPFVGLPPRNNNEFRLLTMTAWRYNKRLDLIPKIAAVLNKKDPNHRYVFVVTLSNTSQGLQAMRDEAARLGISHCIHNVERVAVHDGPALYQACDAMFLPSVLETFSANYPEAMCMERPIITSDLDFAKDICRDAAQYHIPNDVISAALAIISVCHNDALRSRLIAAGKLRLQEFGTRRDRFDAYRRLLQETVT